MSPYLVDRYIMPMFPLTALAAGLFLIYILSFLLLLFDLTRDRSGQCAYGVCVLAVLLQMGALAGYDGEYLYRGYRAQESAAAAYEGEACICVYDGVGYYENLKEFTYYDKSLLLKVEELENRRDIGSIEELGRFVLLLKRGVSADDVLEIFAGKYGFAPRERVLSDESVHGDSIYIMIPVQEKPAS